MNTTQQQLHIALQRIAELEGELKARPEAGDRELQQEVLTLREYCNAATKQIEALERDRDEWKETAYRAAGTESPAEALRRIHYAPVSETAPLSDDFRWFLRTFVNAINFHKWHGTPSMQRAEAELLHNFALKHMDALAAPVTEIAAFSREDAAKLVERKAQTLAEDPDNGYVEGDTNAFIWTNKEAEWQAILLDELAEEFRRG